MTDLKQELIGYIQDIPDEKLIAIKPILNMLSNDIVLLEKITEDDLSDDDLEAVRKGRSQYQNGECMDFEDYLASRS